MAGNIVRTDATKMFLVTYGIGWVVSSSEASSGDRTGTDLPDALLTLALVLLRLLRSSSGMVDRGLPEDKM